MKAIWFWKISTYKFIYLFVCLSSYLFIWLFGCLFICQFMYILRLYNNCFIRCFLQVTTAFSVHQSLISLLKHSITLYSTSILYITLCTLFYLFLSFSSFRCNLLFSTHCTCLFSKCTSQWHCTHNAAPRRLKTPCTCRAFIYIYIFIYNSMLTQFHRWSQETQDKSLTIWSFIKSTYLPTIIINDLTSAYRVNY